MKTKTFFHEILINNKMAVKQTTSLSLKCRSKLYYDNWINPITSGWTGIITISHLVFCWVLDKSAALEKKGGDDKVRRENKGAKQIKKLEMKHYTQRRKYGKMWVNRHVRDRDGGSLLTMPTGRCLLLGKSPQSADEDVQKEQELTSRWPIYWLTS